MKRFKKQLAAWYPVVFLLIFFTLALETAVSKSMTMDEPVHILRGAALWQTGDTRLQYEHTPLSHWTIGSLLPLVKNLPKVDQLPDWETIQHIPLTEQFLWQAVPSPNLSVVVLLARLPVIFAGLFLGAVLARWSQDRLSLTGQMVVMVFYAFSPNLLAHFSLATTDGMLTAVYLMAVFALWRFWQRPGWWRWLLAALLLGLALTAKLTALVLLPLGLVLSYASYFQLKTAESAEVAEIFSPRSLRSLRLKNLSWWQPGLIWLAMLPVAGLVVWGVYGFELRSLPWLAVPLPAATYFNSLRDLLRHSGEGHIAFMQGARSFDGWWNYFLVAFSVKTPAVVLALLAVAVVVLT
ncbi:MAG: glycosyltransferase family 39 protein, partial [Anaerolineae bacterium]|nr:glycosyltransferase family 39 protein [Anaerolineae bacterium]